MNNKIIHLQFARCRLETSIINLSGILEITFEWYTNLTCIYIYYNNNTHHACVQLWRDKNGLIKSCSRFSTDIYTVLRRRRRPGGIG